MNEPKNPIRCPECDGIWLNPNIGCTHNARDFIKIIEKLRGGKNMEIKYLVLKMENEFDMVHLIEKLTARIYPIIHNNVKIKPIYYSLKWKDIAEILIKSEYGDNVNVREN